MNKEQFYFYLGESYPLDSISNDNISEIIREYPYFQTAHILLLKNLFIQKNYKFDKQLKYSYAFIGDRKILYDLLYLNRKMPDTKVKTKNKEGYKHIFKNDDINFKTEDTSSSENMTGISEILSVKPKKEISFAEKLLAKIKTPVTETEILSDNIPDTDFKLKFSELSSQPGSAPSFPINTETEMHSFEDWLSMLSSRPHMKKSIKSTEGGSADKSRKDYDLIEQFIRKKPGTEKPQTIPESMADISASSSKDNDEFITETLAKIYINQKYYQKAISVYQKLSLRFPEKNIYFAGQIEKIKDLINKQ